MAYDPPHASLSHAELNQLRATLAMQNLRLHATPPKNRRIRKHRVPPVLAGRTETRPDGDYVVTTYAPDRDPNRRRKR